MSPGRVRPLGPDETYLATDGPVPSDPSGGWWARLGLPAVSTLVLLFVCGFVYGAVNAGVGRGTSTLQQGASVTSPEPSEDTVRLVLPLGLTRP